MSVCISSRPPKQKKKKKKKGKFSSNFEKKKRTEKAENYEVCYLEISSAAKQEE